MREEQLRRFSKFSKDPRYTTLLQEFQSLYSTVAGTPESENFDINLMTKAVNIACDNQTQTSWLNPNPQEFQVRSNFGSDFSG